jgi:hypothetical protein
VFPAIYVFSPNMSMGKRQLPYIQAYTVCIISNSILYFGALHDGKQASVEQLQ